MVSRARPSVVVKICASTMLAPATAHAPAIWENDYVWPEQQRDLFGPGVPNAVNAACSVNHGATDYSSRAFSYWVSRYLATGNMPPARAHAPRVKTDSSGNVVRDSNGLAEGGLRHAFIQDPVAYEAATGKKPKLEPKVLVQAATGKKPQPAKRKALAATR